ncbi:hypothetical protein DXC21_05855 [Coprobacillus sp. OM08-19]|uniref:hypothetical protein n=1 Tax=Faecalibacillus intestinalis TaxID=1982626 RepID=UPI000E4F4305|nr:hypothetical protein [Faecalibacillus intestinalis]RGI25222.1 hypothetical protein DXC21_05855 [Coprobacillus sp. OM08-19]
MKEPMEIYCVKHFNDILLEFYFSKEILELNTVHITKINHDDEYLLPKYLKNNLNDLALKKWLKSRSIPSKRMNMKEMTKKLNINMNNVQELLDYSKGLSLNDCYWICKKDEDIKFDDINLYDNSFSKEISLLAFNDKNIRNLLIDHHEYSPEFTTGGISPKCWQIVNNKRVLYKGNYTQKLELFSEFYASQIAEVLGFNHVSYNLEEFKDTIASTCPLFTSKNIGFVPIGYFIKGESIGEVNELLKEMSNKNPQIYKDFQNMILFDALIYNTDRHFGNFGFLVDNKTMKIKGLAPIFDNGASLFSNLNIGDFLEINSMTGLNNYARDKSNSYYGMSFEILVQNICSKDMINNLKKLNNFHFKRHSKFNLSENRLKILEEFIDRRILELINIK